MSKVIVYHGDYGCDTGCCGHVIELDGEQVDFDFSHAYGEDKLTYARDLVRNFLGEEHVADLDWDNCLVED